MPSTLTLFIKFHNNVGCSKVHRTQQLAGLLVFAFSLGVQLLVGHCRGSRCQYQRTVVRVVSDPVLPVGIRRGLSHLAVQHSVRFPALFVVGYGPLRHVPNADDGRCPGCDRRVSAAGQLIEQKFSGCLPIGTVEDVSDREEGLR